MLAGIPFTANDSCPEVIILVILVRHSALTCLMLNKYAELGAADLQFGSLTTIANEECRRCCVPTLDKDTLYW